MESRKEKDTKTHGLRQPIQVSIYPARLAGPAWEYLTLHKPGDKTGEWVAVNGDVREGEDLLTAATRELLDQTGLAPSRVKMVGYSHKFPLEDDWQKDYVKGTESIIEYILAAFVDNDQQVVVPADRYDEFRWVRYDQARKLLSSHGAQESLAQCHDFIQGQGE